MPARARALTGPRDDVRVVFRKWGGRPHWEFDAVRLGRDEHGTWLGAPAGTPLARPGAAFTSPQHFVSLVPDDAAFVATFYDDECLPAGGVAATLVEVYVDITTPPEWDGDTVTMVDLDLDVVRGRSGRVWVDDEDEFADHRTSWAYPDHVVRLASSTCDAVLAEVTARRAPYDGLVARRWISLLSERCVS